ncbi:hypothetical protein GCM10017691_56190 [Pseudonocardia petroleophila]|uniref:DUF742 domain-containing protein n=1 Tax=Pseudonocardia petroleophila TaxID=37331 RepID=A0A7G7MNF8_9PSEU|nr:DUF742 domain-containing protein [Pseudonocardia petroleophila]QNG54319.1 DUF742 domain-containing protein [Pseudonocardia petroleophila]
MTSGPDDERRQPSEPTFADVMNGFSFDSARPSRRRRWGRKRTDDAEQAAPAAAPSAVPAARPPAEPVTPGPMTGPIDMRVNDAEQFGAGGGASAVRPYAWTRGRTKSGFDLAIETLVSTSQRGRDQMGLLQVEHRAVAELCEATRSVAEVAALLSLPLGVARVLLGDMAGLGVVTVHQTASSAGSAPDLALMERVLSGLRRL